MRIALTSTSGYSTPPTGYGGETYVAWLCNALCDMGHEVILFATYDSMIPKKGELIRLRKHPQGDWVTMLDTEYDVIRYHRDILKSVDVVHDFAHNAQVSLWCKENKIPYVNTIWGNSFLGNMLGFPSFHRDNVVCWSEAHKHIGVIGGNGYEGTQWYNKYPFAGNLNPTTKVVLGGADTDFYFHNPNIKREDWFLWFSRAHESKGIDLAIDIARNNPDYKFKFSGSFTGIHENDGNNYITQIKSLPNCEYIQMPLDSTHHAFKRSLYQRCKALLFSVQYQESFGLIPAEAMSTGCPIISSDRGSMPELIENGVNGFLCNDIEHYKNAMINIDYIKPWICRKKSLDKFKMSRVAMDYENIYKLAISGVKW